MIDSRRTIQEIYGLDVEVLYTEYKAKDIHQVVINGNTYTNYGAYSFILEKSYIKSPKRASDGSISNLNSYQTFITPHLIIDFSIISIDDWRSLMQQHLAMNEFTVECYDTIYDKTFKGKMYFATEEMPKLNLLNRRRFDSNKNVWEDFIAIAGVESYKLEMIGTNAPFDKVSVVYHKNPPLDGYTDETIGEVDIYSGEQIVIGQAAQDWYNETFDGRYKFKCWNLASKPTDKNKNNLLANTVYTVNDNLVLYAQWESTTVQNLHFSYGLSSPEIQNGQYWYSKEVSKDKAIGTLPLINPKPSVTYEEKEYFPYENGGWYQTAIKGIDSKEVTADTPYWSDYDSTIYCLYNTISYTVTYHTNRDNINIDTVNVKYGEQVFQPDLYVDNAVFKGWYLDEAFTKKLSGTMPPYPIDLYAKWDNK